MREQEQQQHVHHEQLHDQTKVHRADELTHGNDAIDAQTRERT